MFQQSSYAECCVHRRQTIGGIIARCLLITFLVIGVLGMIFFYLCAAMALTLVCFIIAAVSIFLTIYMFPRFTVDWEYIFVDGQLDFDQMLGGNARKHKDRIDFDQTEAVAPTGSYHLDSFNHIDTTVLDYSSLCGNPTYTLIGHKGDKMVRIIFEPDENMVNLMKQKSPRKVFTE
jgi:hypothetical protein